MPIEMWIRCDGTLFHHASRQYIQRFPEKDDSIPEVYWQISHEISKSQNSAPLWCCVCWHTQMLKTQWWATHVMHQQIQDGFLHRYGSWVVWRTRWWSISVGTLAEKCIGLRESCSKYTFCKNLKKREAELRRNIFEDRGKGGPDDFITVNEVMLILYQYSKLT